MFDVFRTMLARRPQWPDGGPPHQAATCLQLSRRSMWLSLPTKIAGYKLIFFISDTRQNLCAGRLMVTPATTSLTTCCALMKWAGVRTLVRETQAAHWSPPMETTESLRAKTMSSSVRRKLSRFLETVALSRCCKLGLRMRWGWLSRSLCKVKRFSRIKRRELILF